MIAPRRPWLLPEPIADPPTFPGFGRAVATLLARRGIGDAAALERFVGAGEASLLDLRAMADATVALDRLDGAIAAGERIAIWGDYDADGMTSIAVWVIALRRLGIEPLRYVPSRLEEGYGLSLAGVRRLADAGTNLIVTCDCGVSNGPEIEAARSLGVDVIVTDHHVPPAELPPAIAVVDPHRADCAFPDRDLTGAGLSYRLARELLHRHGRSADGLAAIAAIGTVADVAPLTGESRTIVRLGLAELATTGHAGLSALVRRAVSGGSAPTARDLAFGLAPRINAAGRIAEAELAIALLLEEDPATAETLADELEAVQLRRRELTATAVEQARALVADASGVGPLLVRRDDWPPGIIGLVAGRLSEELDRPVAAVCLAGEELRGSVRAPGDFHVAAALARCAEHLLKRGGHAAAGGFSLSVDGWDAFASVWQGLPRPLSPAGAGAIAISATAVPPRALAVDLVLPASQLGWSLTEQLQRLAPFGPGNVEPILAITGLRVADVRRVGPGEAHLSFRLRRGLETVDGIAFRLASAAPLPAAGTELDVVATLESDVYQGIPRWRLRVLDYADTSASPLLARRVGHVPAPALALGG